MQRPGDPWSHLSPHAVTMYHSPEHLLMMNPHSTPGREACDRQSERCSAHSRVLPWRLLRPSCWHHLSSPRPAGPPQLLALPTQSNLSRLSQLMWLLRKQPSCSPGSTPAAPSVSGHSHLRLSSYGFHRSRALPQALSRLFPGIMSQPG